MEGRWRPIYGYLSCVPKCFGRAGVGVKWPNDLDRGITTMNALVQSQCTLAIKIGSSRAGVRDIANQFCVYCMVGDAVCAAVRFLRCVTVVNTNLAVSDLSATPLLQFHRHAGVEGPRRS